MNAIVPLEAAAPPPLAALEHVVISPANLQLEARLQDQAPLSKVEEKKLREQLMILEQQLAESDYYNLAPHKAEYQQDLDTLEPYYLELVGKLDTAPDDPHLNAQYNELMDVADELKSRLKLIEKLYYSEYARRLIEQRLQDNPYLIRRQQAEEQLKTMMLQESRIYQQLIVACWSRMGYKYEYTSGKNKRVDRVKIERVEYSLDAIYFKILVSQKTLMGWKDCIPNGVHVSDLVSDDTCFELSKACQRQVSATHNNNGAWIVVHRLDSVDGLVNYIRWESVMTRYPHKDHNRMPIPIGVGLHRQVWWVSLSEYPHWLIGGYTKAGKSNLVNVAICTLITRQSPDVLRLVLIDLKGGLEFSFYENIPHLLGGIVDEVDKVAERLSQVEAMMIERFETLKEARVKKIEDYHSKYSPEAMPRLVCVFDEVASISNHGETTDRITASLEELVRKGRAVGIHIWLCTQRPDVKVVSGSIKANLALRISGRMPDTASSQTILGTGAAKDLAPIQGRMVLQTGPDVVQIQTPHIEDLDVTESLKRAKAFPDPEPIHMPETSVIHQAWTPERIAQVSVTHCKGNISVNAVWKEVQESMSREQCRKLVEAVWALPTVQLEDGEYHVKSGKGKERKLVKVA